jgi:CubicO group peptidase (beta-lactamase class C family)
VQDPQSGEMLAPMLERLSDYVAEVAIDSGIPALSIAVWNDGEVRRAAYGVLNTETGVRATVDSIFQIGSISKVFTASLVMLLVDEGKIALDGPVISYLPELKVGGMEVSHEISIRHLLTHTSGLASDLPFGTGDESIEDYVRHCRLLPYVHRRPGERFSYSNAAYVLVGRVVELITGISWSRAIEERIFAPLGMNQAAARPQDTLRYRAAIGHTTKGREGRDAPVVSQCYLPLGLAPAGAVLMVSAGDLVKFGIPFLKGGMNNSGLRWMSQESVEVMKRPYVSMPAPCLLGESDWALGWAVFGSHAVDAIGHGGGTIGQQAFLGLIPHDDCIVSVELNGAQLGGATVLQRIMADLFKDETTAEIKQFVAEISSQDLERFVGTFGTSGWRYEITIEGGGLWAGVKTDGELDMQSRFSLQPTGPDQFSSWFTDGERGDDFAFFEPDDEGLMRTLFSGYRLHPRISFA